MTCNTADTLSSVTYLQSLQLTRRLFVVSLMCIFIAYKRTVKLLPLEKCRDRKRVDLSSVYRGHDIGRHETIRTRPKIGRIRQNELKREIVHSNFTLSR